jgi:hypothetical protein
VIRTGVLLALLSGVSPCIAQEAPVTAPMPVVSPKPVATDNEMLHKYVWSTIGLDGAIGATLGSGLDQLRTSPTEWGAGREGYARRWVSNYAESAIGDGAKYAVAHFFHQDPSFYPCECTGFFRRLHHAVDSPFMGRTRTGRRVLSAASLAGVLAGNVVPAATWYPAPLGTRDGLKHAGTSLLTKIAIDVFKEFRPRKHTT